MRGKDGREERLGKRRGGGGGGDEGEERDRRGEERRGVKRRGRICFSRTFLVLRQEHRPSPDLLAASHEQQQAALR